MILYLQCRLDIVLAGTMEELEKRIESMAPLGWFPVGEVHQRYKMFGTTIAQIVCNTVPTPVGEGGLT